MANPWTRNTPAVWAYGAGGASGDNFTSLANGAAKAVGVVQPATLSAPFGDILLPPWKITFASAPTAGNTFTRYLFASEDNTTPVWPGGISPTSTADQYSSGTGNFANWLNYDLVAAENMMIDQITLLSSVTTYYTRWRGLRGFFTDGNIPTFITIICYNQSGVALSSTAANHITTYVTETYN